MNFDLRRLQ